MSSPMDSKGSCDEYWISRIDTDTGGSITTYHPCSVEGNHRVHRCECGDKKEGP